MDINSLTLGQIKEILALVGKASDQEAEDIFFVEGRNYFIRTVTHIDSGRLVRKNRDELVLVKAAWIADTGRYAQAVATGKLDEVEPYPDDMEVLVGRGAIIDAFVWPHDLPREQI